MAMSDGAARGPWQRFGAGMSYPWRGARLVGRNPRLWPLCLGPVATVTGVVALGFSGVSYLAGALLGHGSSHSWLGRIVGAVVALLLFVVYFTLVYFLFAALVSLAASPFCALIAEKAEALATGRPAPVRSLGE